MSIHILEEVRVLHPQQPPRHTVSTIKTFLRRVNDVGKSLAISKIDKACKQLNSLSLDQVYICQTAKSLMRLIVCSFIFCPSTDSSELH
jgi:hypothetical protein